MVNGKILEEVYEADEFDYAEWKDTIDDFSAEVDSYDHIVDLHKQGRVGDEVLESTVRSVWEYKSEALEAARKTALYSQIHEDSREAAESRVPEPQNNQDISSEDLEEREQLVNIETMLMNPDTQEAIMRSMELGQYDDYVESEIGISMNELASQERS